MNDELICVEYHKVPKQKKQIRIQEYLVGVFYMCTTKSSLKKTIKKGLIKINNKTATTATYVCGGELINLYKPKEKLQIKKFNLDLDVLFEDDYLAVISKPAGIEVSGNKFKTITNALVQNLKASKQIDAVKPQPTHRLDFPTTGVLLVGKTSTTIRALNKLFENNAVSKKYIAITIKKMKPKGFITLPIDKKDAQSAFHVLKTVISKRFEYLNLVELTPKTGRRHQLRKHMASLENPILGDKEYGIENLILHKKGLYLHALSIAFIHPITKENIYVESPLPKKFLKIFQT